MNVKNKGYGQWYEEDDDRVRSIGIIIIIVVVVKMDRKGIIG